MSQKKPPHEDDPDLDPDLSDLADDENDPIESASSLEGIIEAIASSGRPRAIAPDVHERILAQALGLDDGETAELGAPAEEPEASAFEKERAAALCRALELARSTSDLDTLEGVEHPDVMRLVALARALRLAFAPTPVDALTSERLLKPALKQPTRRANTRFVAFATAVLAAIAAVFAGFWIQTRQTAAPSAQLDAPHAAIPMTPVHSTDSLFGLDPFPREGGASGRIDKITATRGAELRNNRFAEWGIE